MSETEQRAAIKFCVLLGKSFSETYELIQKAYLSDAYSRTRVYEWHKRFKDGRKSIESDPHPEKERIATSESMVNTARVIVLEDRRITLRELGDILGVSQTTAHTILRDYLHMRKVCARWIPRLLTPEQLEYRAFVCEQWKQRYSEEGDDFLKKIVTCDESWIHFYDPETKRQSQQWIGPNSPKPKKCKSIKSAQKVMILVFFDYQGIIYIHEVPEKQTITGKYYGEVIEKKLLPKLRKKRPNLIANGWLLHQDNASAHTSNFVKELFKRLDIETLPHPPYSPDLAKCDFWLFPNLKNHIRGTKFDSRKELMDAVIGYCNMVSRNGLEFVFRKWTER
jgi:histone-lysine N-methyltransferase SETMAR